MQTLVTKYYGPTSTKPSRIKVTSWKGSKFYNWDCSLGVYDNHLFAAALYIGNQLNTQEHEWKIVAKGDMPCGTGKALIIE